MAASAGRVTAHLLPTSNRQNLDGTSRVKPLQVHEELPGLVLASASPRRRELLARLDVSFAVESSAIDESAFAQDSPQALVVRLAEAKARAVFDRFSRRSGLAPAVFGADTIVAQLDGELLGKPRDDDDARRMLTALSGRSHRVLTGIALVSPGGAADPTVVCDVEVTTVEFRRLSREEIDGYVRSGEPLDKAGAYGIQGRGGEFVASLDGCYYNVIGLPLERTRGLLSPWIGPQATGCDCGSHPLQRGLPECERGA